jgi:regulatory protein YycI of two-component signal transduction system YycFG
LNWKETKTIFIITLLVTNAILAGILLYNRYGQAPEETSLDALLSLMADRQIRVRSLETSYPESVRSLAVSYETYRIDELTEAFFTLSRFEGDETVGGSNYELKVVNDKVLVYAYKGHLVADNQSSAEEAERLADNFLRSLDFLGQDVLRQETEVVDNVIRVTYKERYEEFFLEDAYMVVDVHNGRIVNFERMWLEVDEVGESVPLIDIKRALYQLMTEINQRRQVQAERIEVTEVTVGYRLGGSSLIENIKSGEALPYYRMTTHKGEDYFIEAVEP